MNTKAEQGAEQRLQKVKTTKGDFGIFYPVGYLVVGFPHDADAQRVQQDLFTGVATARCIVLMK